MCIFNPDRILTPRGGTVGNETAKTLLQFQVQSCCLSIGLGVITRRETDGGTNNSTEGIPELGDKLLSPIRHRIPGKTM